MVIFSGAVDIVQKYKNYGKKQGLWTSYYPHYQTLSLIKNGLKIWQVLFSFVDVFYGQPIYEHNDLRVCQSNAAIMFSIARKFKSAFFQPLVIQGKADALPVQQFYFVPLLVDEDKNIPVAGVSPKFVADDP